MGWIKAVKSNTIYLLAAAILMVGTGYFGFRITMSAVRENVKQNNVKITDVEDEVNTLQRRREMLRIDLTRLEAKINALMRRQGLNPNDYSSEAGN